MDRYAAYEAVVRKDTFNRTWVADLYKDGKIYMKAWQYNWRTRKALLEQIEALNVKWVN